jgi:hypothetical protein
VASALHSAAGRPSALRTLRDLATFIQGYT